MNGHGPKKDEVSELREQLEALGAKPEYIKKQIDAMSHHSDFEIFRENMPVISWFSEVRHLLKFWGGRYQGLDVSAVQADAQMSERQFSPKEYVLLRKLATFISNELNDKAASQ